MPPVDRVKSRVTTEDVAREAGVSRATVSHILNGRAAKFPPETQATVLRASRSLGYRPSVVGRALRNGHSDIVVIALPSATVSSGFQNGIDYVAAQVEPLGASVLTRFAVADPQATLEAVLYIQPLAVVDFGGLFETERVALEEAGVMVVPSTRARRMWKGPLPDQAIGEIQVEALTKTLERTIVYASLHDPRGESVIARGRQQGVEDACARRGLPSPASISVELSLVGAVEALRTVTQDGPIAIACFNDDVAVAVVAACRALDLHIPDDVAVIGVDHTQIGQLIDPRLTTIEIDVEREVVAALNELRAHLNGEDWTPEALTDAVVLKQGETTPSEVQET